MEKVEWEDVQGLLRSGFLDLPNAAYILWRFLPGRSEEAKDWLAGLAGRLMRAAGAAERHLQDAVPHRPSRPSSLSTMKEFIKNTHGGDAQTIDIGAINFGLTASGLRALGVEEPELVWFSAEFREGMAPKPPAGSAVARRSAVLGDTGENSPEHWEWGGWNGDQTIDGLLLLYASSDKSLGALIDEELRSMRGAAEPIRTLEGRIDGDRKEHFGFRDGISQPAIEGTAGRASSMSPKQARVSVVKPGEFVLGYLNERGAKNGFSIAPYSGAGHSEVPQARPRDLCRNGTYLVFRQLEQNVPAFNKFISEAAELVKGTTLPSRQEAEEWVAARLVGRMRSGEPLIPPAADSSTAPETRNDFLYYFEDRFGMACPIGAHIRRANPRDAMGPDPNTALRLSKMHRVIRRGRLYGKRLSPDAMGETRNGRGDARGIHFICLNADIAGQFEMVQHTWLNGTHFGGLYNETDPMSHYPPGDGVLTIQHRPTNVRISLPKFVTVRGGSYFFLPGIKALRLLAQRSQTEGAPSVADWASHG
jgi:Dyp-type peroxidase family